MHKLAPKENFNDLLQGKKIDIFYLKNKTIDVAITNYGARVVNLLVPDKDGNITDVVMGFDSFKSFYHSTEPYFGAIIGRYANRIANGTFTIDDKIFHLPINNGKNALHGGPDGFHHVVWDAFQLNDKSVQFTYLSKDGEMGFPGNLSVTVIYTLLNDRQLKIDIEAITDKKTICNFTNHTFFNLNGAGNVSNHLLQINADNFLPINTDLIPLGNIMPVHNTPFDFTNSKTIGKDIALNDIQLNYGNGYDHTFIVNGDLGKLKLAAKATGDTSGITMELFTTEPGLQLYSGNFLQGKNTIKGGVKDDCRTAFCLEPQHFPDSPNQPNFPSTILDVGKVFYSTSVYRFG